MSWSDRLINTYDLCSSEIGKGTPDAMLLPIGHLTQKAQIEVKLNHRGEMICANLVEKNNAVTVIPVSEDSASRSSGISPHPLHDKLIYVAGDYKHYVDAGKAKYFDEYIKQLQKWAASVYSHKTVDVVYKYLKKGTLIHDLIKNGILISENGQLDNKIKLQNLISQSDSFIRFYVEGDLLKPWEDKSLYQSYLDFYNAEHELNKGVCCITGAITYCTNKHPSKLRSSGDKAKIISSNDSTEFTFRGRFATKADAISIGYETSQKIHNALRWLIQKQGYQKDGLTVLIWNVENKPIFNKELFYDFIEDYESPQEYDKKVLETIEEYKNKINPKDIISVMMLEAATEGRLSIICYRELYASEYYKNIEKWYNDCKWMLYRYPKEITTPNIEEIITSIYGLYRNNEMNVNDKLAVRQKKMILPCILFGDKVPNSIFQDAYHQVLLLSNLDCLEWNRSIGVFCALMRKNLIKTNKGKGVKLTMDLNENKENGLESTAYLFGKIAAVYYEIEKYSLHISGQDRDPNAMKYFVQFKRFPWKTVNTLDSLAQPYLIKLKKRKKKLMELKGNLIEELKKRPDAKKMRNLDYDFVLGFECQRIDYEKMLEKDMIKEDDSHDIIK